MQNSPFPLRLKPLLAAGAAFPCLVAVPHATAQQLQEPQATISAPDAPVPESDEQIGFAADALEYDSNSEVVTASGNVQLLREGNRLRADKVVWNRTTGKVEANGNVSVTDPEGNIAYGDRFDVTDSLQDGMVQNMLLVLQSGGRLAAASGQRVNGVYTLRKAAYTGCVVEDHEGCPKEPTWQIKAVRVVYDPVKARVKYTNASVELFGLPLIPLPGFSHPVGDNGGSGLLVPNLRYDRTNGFEVALPYYLKLAPNRDLTVTPHVYTDTLPMLETNYRHLWDRGAYQITGYATYGSRVATGNASSTTPAGSERDFRGYLDASGALQLTPEWSIGGSIRAATDRTFLRRYDISRDDRLRSTLNAQRIGENSYFSIAGWAVQTLRTGDSQGQMPIALPVIDYRLRMKDPLLGGVAQFQANSLAITRTHGQDTQRAFAAFEWNLRKLTPMGQELTFTTYLRGDVYHSSDNLMNSIVSYAGDPGWKARGIAAAAIDMRWPFMGEAFGGVQRIAPRVQIVAAPKIANLSVPNEDARAIDLEDSNLFALNRFSGYDRFEDSTRVTYGMEYSLSLPDFSLESVVGQSYRLDKRESILPEGTGLSDRLSDVVGRTTVRYKDFISFTHRFRLDKDNLSVRRNEIDATIGSRKTYATVGYLRLNRDANLNLEDLQDREELRLGGRVQFARFWSVFGSTVIDLTDTKEDPLSVADGYEPVRHRLGIAYEDDCLTLGLTWRRDYQVLGDARKGNSFQLRLAFRNIGI
ncbi:MULTISPECIES: LPS-assembly protein LptD [Sphingobium]|uniref:LPS-assembly protein LptD n=1 Tax=Sphingobium fuliginis (strain ATCC 27551) TaxID=336203 RepID=A0A292ZI52_SPHSA|nr:MULTISPECIES: LPS assembly protein LptD [Sphingobium]OAP30998.1 organic solvent tolerance protein [Sphingobium sp. 20006FA]KXU31798.1 organic solvent tolerance protein [Sphingobium sp. AM]KYC29714.1 organic solvent tolerance protein [Sphingobium sp. 22B]MCB4862767.1 LPS assembly protein LptD [Sphingobium sp. PNB]PNQ00397.1 organic solvent tolerance protein [Sphingobium sp. SA916]